MVPNGGGSKGGGVGGRSGGAAPHAPETSARACGGRANAEASRGAAQCQSARRPNRCPALTWVPGRPSFPGSRFPRTRAFSWRLIVPNIASAKKNMRKSRAAQARNRAQRSALRTALKKAKVEGASADERTKAVSILDRSARKGLIHRNAAARQKSKLAKAAARAQA